MDKISKKVVVVGEPSTGKSALVQLYCSDGKEFPKEYHMTQVTEIASKISELEGDKDVELIFFDIGGKEIYRNAASKMVKQADFCVLVYDCTNPESFTALDQWSDFVKKANNNKLPKGLLVSTKNDLQSLKKITEE